MYTEDLNAVALFFIGFKSEEISSHIKRFQDSYAATDAKCRLSLK
jgi:hypothetical protein